MTRIALAFCIALIVAVNPGNAAEPAGPPPDLSEQVGPPAPSELSSAHDTPSASSATRPPSATTTPDTLEPEVAPELLLFIEAEYPLEALRAGREGAVVMGLLVNAEGAVDSTWIVESLDPAMDAAARAAASRFVFSPAMAGGEAVAVYVQYRYEFSLRDQAARLDEIVNFRGRVQERGTGSPIQDAVVMVTCAGAAADSTLPVPWTVWRDRIGRFEGQYLEGDRLVTVTDSTGRFAFKTLPPGMIEVAIASPGCHSFATTDTIRAGELMEAEYRITRVGYNQFEIVVFGRKEEKEVTRERLSVAEVERLPGFGGDVIKSVQALPSVSRPSMSDPAAIVVRGSSQYDTRFVLDGIDIPLLFHFGGVKSTYNSLALSSVDLYPGGFGTRYGGCVGGVVEVRGRPARSDQWRTTVDASLLDASFHTEGPLGKNLGLLLTGRRSYAGELLSAAMKSRDDLDMTMAPYYSDLVARLDYEPNPENRFFLTTFAAKDRIALLFPDENEGSPEIDAATDAVDMDMTFSRLILGHDRRIGENLRNELRAAYGTWNENGHVFGFFDYKITGPYYQLRDELSMNARPDLTVKVGLDMYSSPIEYRVQALGWPASEMDLTFSDLGAYTAVELRPAPGLLVTPGLRYDYYDDLEDGKLSLRFTGRYNVRPDHTVTASAGTYNQAPQPQGQATDPVYGNPNLPMTEATHYTLGDEWRINDRTSLKVESYFNRQSKIPALTDSLDLNFVPDAEGRMYGMEVMLRREAGDRFFGWLSYSLSRSERRYARRPAGMGNEFDGGGSSAPDTWDASRWWLFDQDQTHHFEAVGSWSLGRNWSTGARMVYTTGNPATPILNPNGQFEWDADTGDYQQVTGEYLSDRMDPYFRFDCRVEKKFVRKSSIWSVYLDVQNLNYFLYNSPEAYSYNYDYSRRDEYGWIILPALGCRVEF